MKKLIYILICSPIIFFTSCSSGGGGDSSPLPQNNITGVWELQDLVFDGTDLMPNYIQAEYYYHDNGLYEFNGDMVDGSYIYGIGEYSISNGILNTKSITLTGNTAGLYQDATTSLSWVNENEVLMSGGSSPCIGGYGSSRSIKTNNALGNSPNFPVLGVWRATQITLNGQNLLSGISQVLLYFFADGSYGEEYYYPDGSFDYSTGAYLISNDQTQATVITDGVTLALDIVKLEIDQAELYTNNAAGTGQSYTLKLDRAQCITLSNWKK